MIVVINIIMNHCQYHLKCDFISSLLAECVWKYWNHLLNPFHDIVLIVYTGWWLICAPSNLYLSHHICRFMHVNVEWASIDFVSYYQYGKFYCIAPTAPALIADWFKQQITIYFNVKWWRFCDQGILQFQHMYKDYNLFLWAGWGWGLIRDLVHKS